jgi:hypothetical protein
MQKMSRDQFVELVIEKEFNDKEVKVTAVVKRIVGLLGLDDDHRSKAEVDYQGQKITVRWGDTIRDEVLNALLEEGRTSTDNETWVLEEDHTKVSLLKAWLEIATEEEWMAMQSAFNEVKPRWYVPA